MPKEKVESKKFIITQEQIDAVIENITTRFILKAKFILVKDLKPLEPALEEKFKLFQKLKMKLTGGKWEIATKDWEEFKKEIVE